MYVIKIDAIKWFEFNKDTEGLDWRATPHKGKRYCFAERSLAFAIRNYLRKRGYRSAAVYKVKYRRKRTK